MEEDRAFPFPAAGNPSAPQSLLTLVLALLEAVDEDNFIMQTSTPSDVKDGPQRQPKAHPLSEMHNGGMLASVRYLLGCGSCCEAPAMERAFILRMAKRLRVSQLADFRQDLSLLGAHVAPSTAPPSSTPDWSVRYLAAMEEYASLEVYSPQAVKAVIGGLTKYAQMLPQRSVNSNGEPEDANKWGLGAERSLLRPLVTHMIAHGHGALAERIQAEMKDLLATAKTIDTYCWQNPPDPVAQKRVVVTAKAQVKSLVELLKLVLTLTGVLQADPFADVFVPADAILDSHRPGGVLVGAAFEMHGILHVEHLVFSDGFLTREDALGGGLTIVPLTLGRRELVAAVGADAVSGVNEGAALWTFLGRRLTVALAGLRDAKIVNWPMTHNVAAKVQHQAV